MEPKLNPEEEKRFNELVASSWDYRVALEKAIRIIMQLEKDKATADTELRRLKNTVLRNVREYGGEPKFLREAIILAREP